VTNRPAEDIREFFEGYGRGIVVDPDLP